MLSRAGRQVPDSGNSTRWASTLDPHQRTNYEACLRGLPCKSSYYLRLGTKSIAISTRMDGICFQPLYSHAHSNFFAVASRQCLALVVKPGDVRISGPWQVLTDAVGGSDEGLELGSSFRVQLASLCSAQLIFLIYKHGQALI